MRRHRSNNQSKNWCQKCQKALFPDEVAARMFLATRRGGELLKIQEPYAAPCGRWHLRVLKINSG